jgi:hypothetical protein
MKRNGFLVGWIAILSGAMLVSTASGCGKKKDGDTAEKAEKADKGGEGGKKKKDKDGDKYATFDLFKHTPKSCKFARVYMNVGLFLKNEAVEKSAESLEDKLASSVKQKDQKELAKALKSLKKAGIEPAKDVKELAICGNDDKDDVTVVIGGDFAGKNPLDAIVKAAEDDKDVEKKEADGIEYVKEGKAYIASVSPNVLVVTKSKSAFADLKDTGTTSGDWEVGKGQLVTFTMSDKKKGKFSGTIAESGEDLDFKFVGDFGGNTGEKIESDPAAFKKELQKQLDFFSSKLSKGPFKKIADDIGSAKVKVDGSKVTVSLTIPASDLGDTIKKVAEMEPDELGKSVDL